MLIRSQDKKKVINFNTTENLFIYGKEIRVTFTSGNFALLGIYSTEAKAIKVLDKIQDAYSYSKDIQAFIDLGIPFEVMNNKVFQMPQDEEVEEQQ